jgi:hypothetical protein
MLDKSHKHVTCSTCVSRKISLFGTFCEDELKHLEENHACSHYKKNQSLFLESSFPRGVKEGLRYLKEVMRAKNKSFTLLKQVRL